MDFTIPCLSRLTAAMALTVALAGKAVAAGDAAGKDKIDFNSQIRPILSAHCFHCHGPDEKSRKAKLRLDLREEAVRERDELFPIKPGDLKKSEMIRRISLPKDSDDVMPPSEADNPLKSAQIELLKKWVQQGAPYSVHWAFVKPERPAVRQSNTRHCWRARWRCRVSWHPPRRLLWQSRAHGGDHLACASRSDHVQECPCAIHGARAAYPKDATALRRRPRQPNGRRICSAMPPGSRAKRPRAG